MYTYGSCEEIQGGFVAALAVTQSLVDENPLKDQGMSNMQAYTPTATVRLKPGVLDTDVTPATFMSQYAPFQGVPGSDTAPSNCATMFGGQAVNSALCARLGAAGVQNLLDARKAEAAAAPKP